MCPLSVISLCFTFTWNFYSVYKLAMYLNVFTSYLKLIIFKISQRKTKWTKTMTAIRETTIIKIILTATLIKINNNYTTKARTAETTRTVARTTTSAEAKSTAITTTTMRIISRKYKK